MNKYLNKINEYTLTMLGDAKKNLSCHFSKTQEVFVRSVRMFLVSSRELELKVNESRIEKSFLIDPLITNNAIYCD